MKAMCSWLFIVIYLLSSVIVRSEQMSSYSTSPYPGLFCGALKDYRGENGEIDEGKFYSDVFGGNSSSDDNEEDEDEEDEDDEDEEEEDEEDEEEEDEEEDEDDDDEEDDDEDDEDGDEE
ncbi:unnamed protein product [Rodentolepis nana]|uniref:Uncharacterized protein n=1 Tax=Rodentolepis nana TaxID=102285 RepID=A0A0R3TLQ4_RODNA|nr:unnamed protein product [Rodentolepis nana]